MAKITKVSYGPLIKKKGPFKGSTLKNGGNINNYINKKTMATIKKTTAKKTVKKAQDGIIAKASKAVSGAADKAGKWIKAHQTGGDETDRQRNLPSASKTVAKPKAKCGAKMKKK